MRAPLRTHGPFVLANVVVMVILHGNDRQFWPKIPYLSLRDESEAEHSRLLFNALAIVTVGQLLLRRLPRSRLLPRIFSLALLPATLPPLLALQRRLGLRGPLAEVYNLSLVWLLPFGTALAEEQLQRGMLGLEQGVIDNKGSWATGDR